MGVETALYARYLGYHVALIEQRGVAAQVRQWGHLEMDAAFRQCRSTLGLAALRAQDPAYQPPGDGVILTGKQWAENYVTPLARTDLVVDQLRIPSRVVRVDRFDRAASSPAPSASERPAEAGRFRILVASDGGRESLLPADVVVDTTGVMTRPRGCGPDGTPVVGERALAARIEYGLPDVARAQRACYAGHRTLVVGSEVTAARTLRALAQLAELDGNTSVQWAVRAGLTDDQLASAKRHIARVAPAWKQTTDRAVRYARDPARPRVQCVDAAVDSILFDESRQVFEVSFRGRDTTATFDRIVVNAGYRPDASIHENLGVVLDPVFGCLATLAQPLRGARPLTEYDPANWRDWLPTTEPHFYILGAKTFGGFPGFRFAIGLDQVRALFQILGGRETLDLYATAP